MPPATTAFTMSGKQPVPCKQGQSQNSDFMFHRQLPSWESGNCYRCCGQLLVWGQLSGSGGLNTPVPPATIRFPWEFGPTRSGSAGSGNLWLLLNQFRAASESWGKQPQELAHGGAEGSLTGKRTIHKEKQCQFTTTHDLKILPWHAESSHLPWEVMGWGNKRTLSPHTHREGACNFLKIISLRNKSKFLNSQQWKKTVLWFIGLETLRRILWPFSITILQPML